MGLTSRRRVLLLSAAAVFVTAALSQNSPNNQKPQDSAKNAQASSLAMKTDPAKNDPSQYVGTETCRTCHEEEFKSHEAGPHWKTSLASHAAVDKQGCEACHGPGKEHAEGGDPTKITSFKNIGSQEASKRCLTCHQLGEEHSNFLRSAHQKNNIGCIDCHSAHQPKVKRALLKNAQPQLCYDCHLETKPDFSKPFHHRVNEGLVKCVDCHNPHGGFLQQRQLRSTSAQDAVCFKCHAEKAGPFVFEHPAGKIEGCVACHTPHGSPNPRLLKRANMNLLCLECHTLTVDSAAPGIPSFHNQAQKYQACTMCHTAIHGSNLNNRFFK
jgi:DmsE family decaheme c-type cytochrome